LGNSWRIAQVDDRVDKKSKGMIAGLGGLLLAFASPRAAVPFATAASAFKSDMCTAKKPSKLRQEDIMCI
jgi:hypothetical protein